MEAQMDYEIGDPTEFGRTLACIIRDAKLTSREFALQIAIDHPKVQRWIQSKGIPEDDKIVDTFVARYPKLEERRASILGALQRTRATLTQERMIAAQRRER